MRIYLLVVLLLLIGCRQPVAERAAEASLPAPSATTPLVTTQVALADAGPSSLPAIVARQERLAAALQSPPYVLALDGLDAAAERAQAAALADMRVQQVVRSTASGAPQRAEVFGVELAGAGALSPSLAALCRTRGCYRVVIYLYLSNATLTATVERVSDAVLDVALLEDAQADVPPDLAAIAVELARTSPATRAALQMRPEATMATMAATKTALNRSACERSRHLCVAPTFVWGERALWVVVDLTDYRVVGTRWSDLGESGRRSLASEARIQNEVLDQLCEQPQQLVWGDWQLDYVLTPSDGLEVRNARYQGQAVLVSAKIVDWHVSYSRTEGFGYADGTGCPSFSSSAVLPLAPPITRTIALAGGAVRGVQIEQLFRSDQWPQPCNYAYAHRFTFYTDGRFFLEGENRGRGCGTDAIYRPVFRLQLAGEQQQLATWQTDGWNPWSHEGWLELTPRTPSAPAGAALRFAAAETHWMLVPDWQTGDAIQSYLYATRARDDEGGGDLPTIGGCCSQDERQGPELFIGPPGQPGGRAEVLEAGPLTLWYVPSIPNAERVRCWADARLENGVLVPDVWPCAAGLMLVPES